MDDRRRDGGTNSTLRTKEQGEDLTLNEHDDDDDDDDDAINYISGMRQTIRLFCITCRKNVKKATHVCHFWMTIL